MLINKEEQKLTDLRDKMIFRAYASKDLDVIESKFSVKHGEIPKAFMVRSPFGIYGSLENRKKLVVSKKYGGAYVIAVPLLLDKKQLENTIAILGENTKTLAVKRHQGYKKLEFEEGKKKEAQEKKRKNYYKYCPHCGQRFKTDFYKPAKVCGKAKCKGIQKQRDTEFKKERMRGVVRGKEKLKTPPDFNLDDPAHDSLQGYVYCIRAENGLCKIGRSNNIEKRFSDISSMSPVGVTLEHAVFADNYVAAEERAHLILSSFRHHGEWFNLPKERHDWFLSLDKYDLDT